MIIKNVLNNKGETILSLTDWEVKASPKKKEQWKKGRSAQTHAEYIFSNHKELDEVLKNYTKCNECTLYVEKTTGLKMLGSGGPRNHDSLMIFDDLIVGVEAKVDETLDKKLKDYDSYKDPNKKRYSGIAKMIYGDDVDLDKVGEMYYQLLSGAYGTFIEAIKNKKSKALFLIITYITELADSKKLETNKKAIEEYIKSIPNDGNKMIIACNKNNVFKLKEQVDFYIKHITIDLTKKG